MDSVARAQVMQDKFDMIADLQALKRPSITATINGDLCQISAGGKITNPSTPVEKPYKFYSSVIDNNRTIVVAFWIRGNNHIATIYQLGSEIAGYDVMIIGSKPLEVSFCRGSSPNLMILFDNGEIHFIEVFWGYNDYKFKILNFKRKFAYIPNHISDSFCINSETGDISIFVSSRAYLSHFTIKSSDFCDFRHVSYFCDGSSINILSSSENGVVYTVEGETFFLISTNKPQWYNPASKMGLRINNFFDRSLIRRATVVGYTLLVLTEEQRLYNLKFSENVEITNVLYSCIGDYKLSQREYEVFIDIIDYRKNLYSIIVPVKDFSPSYLEMSVVRYSKRGDQLRIR